MIISKVKVGRQFYCSSDTYEDDPQYPTVYVDRFYPPDPNPKDITSTRIPRKTIRITLTQYQYGTV